MRLATRARRCAATSSPTPAIRRRCGWSTPMRAFSPVTRMSPRRRKSTPISPPARPVHPGVRPGRGEIDPGKPMAPAVANPREGAAEALYGLGGAGTRQGDELASLIYLRLALALRPDHDFAQVSVANLLADLKRGQ